MKDSPFGARPAGEAPSRHLLRWLKTVVVNEVKKVPREGIRRGSERRTSDVVEVVIEGIGTLRNPVTGSRLVDQS